MPDSGSERQPFDQRYLAFVLLSMLILMFFNPLGRPPVDEPPPEQAAADADAPAEQAPKPKAIADVDAEAEPADAEPIEAEPAAAPQRIALGSLAADGPHRLLATFTNTGAAVERIELSSPDFRDLDDRSGYLGALALEGSGSGAVVTTVGPGTPAAAAGLQVGDVITSVESKKLPGPDGGGWQVKNQMALDTLLADTKPGDEVTLTVERNGAAVALPVTLTRRPLALIRPEAENIRLHRSELPDDYQPAPSYRVTLARLNDLTTDDSALAAANQALADETWTVDTATATEVVFRKRLPELRIEVVKRFRLPTVPEAEIENRNYRGYHLDLEVEVVNLADAPQAVAYTIEGANGLPIEGWWYSNKVGREFGRYGIRDIVVHYHNTGPEMFACSEVVKDDVGQLGQGASMAYIGVDAQYFAAALLPEKQSFADVQFRTAETRLATPKLLDRQGSFKPDLIFNNPTFLVTTNGIDLPPGAAAKDAYTLFTGPKRDNLLAEYFTAGDTNYSLKGFAYYGWFAPIARLMLGILHFFYAIVGNYGLAIILLTMLVRGCMVPISLKQAKNMAMMQRLKPEMDRIAAKYKDDRQKQARAQQELFAKHNYNPLGGCLPMLLQLPIFIGLYRALAVDVELRQAPLFSESIRWCSNLAAPDMFIDWSGMWWQSFNNGQGMFYLGPFFNLLPIASVALILVQQKLFMPPAQNEQMELQQKMMKYMMGFMAFLFFKMASGLCLYFIASGAWGIAERKLLPKPTGDDMPPPAASTKKSPAKKPSPGTGGASKSAKKKKSKKRK